MKGEDELKADLEATIERLRDLITQRDWFRADIALDAAWELQEKIDSLTPRPFDG